MVYYSGSRNARSANSICNRTNTCGGIKKGGIVSRIGLYMPSNPKLIGASNTQYGLVCKPSTTIQTQAYGYRATIGGRMG
jgi:hypothetical protein